MQGQLARPGRRVAPNTVAGDFDREVSDGGDVLDFDLKATSPKR